MNTYRGQQIQKKRQLLFQVQMLIWYFPFHSIRGLIVVSSWNPLVQSATLSSSLFLSLSLMMSYDGEHTD